MCPDFRTAFRRALVVEIVGFKGGYTESFVSTCKSYLYQADDCEQDSGDEGGLVGHHLLARDYKNGVKECVLVLWEVNDVAFRTRFSTQSRISAHLRYLIVEIGLSNGLK